jgi:hypothetical protein
VTRPPQDGLVVMSVPAYERSAIRDRRYNKMTLNDNGFLTRLSGKPYAVTFDFQNMQIFLQ